MNGLLKQYDLYIDNSHLYIYFKIMNNEQLISE